MKRKLTQNKNKNKRQRNILWFTPTFNKQTKTNIGKIFLQLIDKHFPPNNPLHKIFNRNNVKVSYSCADNIEKIIKQHNNKIIEKHINKKTETEKSCNCNDKRTCPLDNNCLKSSIVYKATVTTEEEPEDKKYYIGIAKTTFKIRFGNHKQSLNNEHYRNSTSLSRYFWDQKEKDP